MPLNKNQSNYSKRPTRRVRLLKIVPKKTKSLFEEYFYAFVAIITGTVMILGKAGGLSGYNAVVTGLWAGGFTWFAWMLRGYRKQQASGAKIERAKQAAETLRQETLYPNSKAMVGPQWPWKAIPAAPKQMQGPFRPVPSPAKPLQAPAPAAQTLGTPPSNSNKRVFVYERPTLPDRKPKLPNNWPGRPDKKPKR